MVEAFEDLKAKFLGCPEKEEKLTEEVDSGGGETVTTKTVCGGEWAQWRRCLILQQRSGEQFHGEPGPPQAPRERTSSEEPKLILLGMKFDGDLNSWVLPGSHSHIHASVWDNPA